MFNVGGGTALYATHPLDRCLRDIYASNQHFSVSIKFVEAAGRVLLGLEPGVPNF
jgi:hypothetical protein